MVRKTTIPTEKLRSKAIGLDAHRVLLALAILSTVFACNLPLSVGETASETFSYSKHTWQTSQPDTPYRHRPPPGLSPMRKGVCATQPAHFLARQSTFSACLTLLPSGETASLERNLTYW
eukprot:592623-Rhodomonas_salina.1